MLWRSPPERVGFDPPSSITRLRATETAHKHLPASCPRKVKPCRCSTSLLMLAVTRFFSIPRCTRRGHELGRAHRRGQLHPMAFRELARPGPPQEPLCVSDLPVGNFRIVRDYVEGNRRSDREISLPPTRIVVSASPVRQRNPIENQGTRASTTKPNINTIRYGITGRMPASGLTLPIAQAM